MTHSFFSFEEGSSLALFLRSSFFWIYHITSSTLSDKHLARWPSISSCDSLQIQRIFSVSSQILLFSLFFTLSFPKQSRNCSSSSMGESFLCSEALQSATNSCSCYYLLLDNLIMSLTRRQCSHSICSGQVMRLLMRHHIRLLIQDRKPLPYSTSNSNLRIQETRFLIEERCFLLSAFSSFGGLFL